jgi:hypothetical protein
MSDYRDDKQPNGFTVNEMSRAFDRVKSAENWKNPISKIIEIKGDEDARLITEAVIFYTGSVPTITPLGMGKFGVKAAGYYLTVGA